MASTANHSDVRGRHSGGAASESAIALKNGNVLFIWASSSTDLRNGMLPPIAYGFCTFALVAHRMNSYAQRWFVLPLGIASSQFPISGASLPPGPAGASV